MAYDRETLRKLAGARLMEAKVLLDAGQPSGAYYLAGYAIECAIKARIAGQFRENEIPDRGFVNEIYTHDLRRLIRFAGLQAELDEATQADAELGQKWAIVRDWSEQSRYEIWTREEASAMIAAAAGDERREGLFQWLISRW
jgi:HEPN domain-containing protein